VEYETETGVYFGVYHRCVPSEQGRFMGGVWFVRYMGIYKVLFGILGYILLVLITRFPHLLLNDTALTFFVLG